MSLLEYNVLTKRIAETENAIASAMQISDDVLREMILSETRRRLQQLYKKGLSWKILCRESRFLFGYMVITSNLGKCPQEFFSPHWTAFKT